MDTRRLWETFYLAALAMAQGGGTIQDRLQNAYVSHLVMEKPEELPDDLRDLFLEVCGIAKFANVTDEEARRAAELIVSLHNRAARMDALDEHHDDSAQHRRLDPKDN